MRGIKLGPNYQNVDPLSEEAFRSSAVQRNWDYRSCSIKGPRRTSSRTSTRPPPAHRSRGHGISELRLILAHMGHPWQVDCIAVIRKHPHVYADISAQFYRPWSYYNAFRLASEWGTTEKLLFGSDLPVATPQETMDALAGE